MKVVYNNLYTHFVFSTIERIPFIHEENRVRIEKYIIGIVKMHNCSIHAIYANPDHLHFLVSRCPEVSEETLATIVAESSEKYINDNKLCDGIFSWQESCSAISVSKDDVERVRQFINNQQEHHKKVTFLEEFNQFIRYYLKAKKIK